MTIADELTERAMALARAGVPTEEAVAELLLQCGDKRVSVVKARQSVLDRTGEGDPVGARAVELLDEVLERLPAV